MEPKWYYLEQSQREVGMFGAYVAVCWNTKELRQEMQDEQGQSYIKTTRIHDGLPYITFMKIRTNEATGKSYSPLHGAVEMKGLNLKAAQQVLQELSAAVHWLEEQTTAKVDV